MSFYIYTYPEPRELLVKSFRQGMELVNHPIFNDVRVATKKTASPDKQVIIRYDGGAEVAQNVREEAFALNVYAPDAETVSELAQQVESAVLWMKHAPNRISNTWLEQRALEIENPTGTELREITATALIKGKKTQLNP